MRIVCNIILILLLPFICLSQERTAPLYYNARVHAAAVQNIMPLAKTTTAQDTIQLPFFDDFTTYNIFPDNTRWTDNEVYVNNTMGVDPPTRGVATLDALDAHGIPYDTSDNSHLLFADSLTSVPIDLGSLTPGDSVYISFFYQPQGYGFYPLTADSLLLFLHKNNNDWREVWAIPGSTLTPFTQVMIPVADTVFFYKGFQFRFVNMSAFNYSGSQWNIDYVRMNKNRNMYDTAINDVTFTNDPSFLLNDYTYMPYRQFLANISGERATRHSDTFQNYTNASQTIPYSFTARETTTNTFLAAAGPTSITVPAYTEQGVSYPMYTATIPSPGMYKKVVFENTYYLQSPASDTNKVNDTIVREQVFDNYLAYDDGTAEQSYFLDLFPTLPGYLAIEYHLNQPDTMRGMAIYFGRQVPIPTLKTFSLFVYSKLQGIDGAANNDSLYWQEGFGPGYADTINHFWVYKFDQPVPLPAGTFYAGVFMPAFSGSDSLYFGLDMNRIGGNHAYYSVLDAWNSSSVSGAIMIRPVLGQPISGTEVPPVNKREAEWTLSPNPAHDRLQLKASGVQVGGSGYMVTDIYGKTLLTGALSSDNTINISTLQPGMYFVRLVSNSNIGTAKKFIKE